MSWNVGTMQDPPGCPGAYDGPARRRAGKPGQYSKSTVTQRLSLDRNAVVH